MNKKLLIGLVLVLLLSFTSVFGATANAEASYNFDSGLLDQSGNGTTATQTGCTLNTSTYLVGDGSYWCNGGAGSTINLGEIYLGSNTAFSTGGFFYLNSVTVDQNLFKTGVTNSNGFYLYFAPSLGVLRLQFNSGTAPRLDMNLAALNINASEWFHIWVQHDGTTAKVYLNNVEVGSKAMTYSTPTTNNFNLMSFNGGSGYTKGNVDQFMIYARALSTDDRTALYNSKLGLDPYYTPPPNADILTIQVKDADNGTNVNNVSVLWDGDNYFNTTGNIVKINITAEGGNASALQNFSVSSINYTSVSVLNWNITNIYYANLTGLPLEDFEILNVTSDIDSFETGLDGWDILTSFSGTPAISDVWATLGNKSLRLFSSNNLGGGYASVNKTFHYTDSFTFDYRFTAGVSSNGIRVYDDGVLIYSDFSTSTTIKTDVQINFTAGSNIEIRTVSANTWSSSLYIDNIRYGDPVITNADSYNVTWTQAISPTGKTVTYNTTVYYASNSTQVYTNTTNNLYQEIDLTNFKSNIYTISVNATESSTGLSFVHNMRLVVNRTNYLYFYDDISTNPIQNANVTITLPNYGTDIILVTDSDGKVSFGSFYNDTFQNGNYSITFEAFIGYVTPITFTETYNSLPINESFYITVTNINITLYYRTNFSIFDRSANVVIEGILNQTVSNGSVLIQNATILNGVYRIYVFSNGFFNEQKDFTFTGQDDLDLGIYLLQLNNSNSGTITVRTIDEFQRLLDDVTVNLLEYDPSTLSYLQVSECLTNSNGECKFLIQTNTKSYKFTASKTVNGNVVTSSTESQIFEDDISGGQIVLFSEQTITLTLSGLEQFEINAIQNIIFNSIESFNNVSNQSNIVVNFRSIDGTNLEVCVEYFSILGGVETSLTGNTFCVVGSSGAVTENAYFTLNRSKEYVAKVYIKTDDGNILLEQYRYKSMSSFSQRLIDNATLPFVFLFIWIFLIGGGLALKNVPLTGVSIIVGTWVLAFFFPTITIISASVMQTLIGISLIWNGRKKEDFQ